MIDERYGRKSANIFWASMILIGTILAIDLSPEAYFLLIFKINTLSVLYFKETPKINFLRRFVMTGRLLKLAIVFCFTGMTMQSAYAQTNLPPEPFFPPAPAGTVPGKSNSAEAGKALLVVRTVPPGVNVQVNGFLLGQTPFSGPVNTGNNILLWLQMDGYYPQQYVINLLTGQTLSLHFSLTKIPPAIQPYIP